ncbi:MAG: divergent polysaccharide deacetylase family protein [Sneathiella sp.]|nr:divergent polysaccharide deacetylase family protein [Sneathiella sp.]
MKSRHKGMDKPAKISSTERLIESPIRLAVLCVAVLVISASGGILIGKFFKPFENPHEIATVSALAMPQPQPVIERSPFTSNNYPPETMEKGVSVPVLPGIGETDNSQEPPWKRYAALAPPRNGKPMIAMIIDDVGLSQERVDELAELPALLTLAFLPYAPALQSKVDQVRSRGDEVMLHLPMEPTDDHMDPGPDALLTELSDDEIRRRTIKNLDSFTGYVGVNNHMGSRFTANGKAMAIVMDIMAQRGLLFLDSKTTAASTGYRLAVERGMPSAKRDVFIDNVIAEQAILLQLQKVERIAEHNGVAIAIGHPHPATIEALKKWLPEMKKRGFLFVPVSVITALTFEG